MFVILFLILNNGICIILEEWIKLCWCLYIGEFELFSNCVKNIICFLNVNIFFELNILNFWKFYFG